jgi:hypothetical protein
MQQQITIWLDTLTQKSNKTDNACGMKTKFVEERGKKYTKIVKEEFRENDRVSKSVHAFIDHNSGDIFKAASWKAPAKIVRYNIVKDFDTVIQSCDIYGSYLYIR